MRPHAVYRCRSADDRLLYIGCSHAPLTRAVEHGRIKAWATDIARIDVEWFPSKREARAAEKEAFEAEKPEWNVHFNENPKHSRGTLCAGFSPYDRSTWAVNRTPQ